ncbi:unnamed protein product [Phaedon cochleariae]|uniref:PHD-type domain-containing protein n=1 Tax=Phaedon cochleariae TaxID=80249 RepID=A0A9P0GUC5_PHACE|nr:unnamed protein product [Phaedon cochleariae]
MKDYKNIEYRVEYTKEKKENDGGDSLKTGIEDPEDADIDTDLLCPDIIMEVKSDSIATGNELIQECKNEPFSLSSSAYDYNITGARAQFKLNAEEEQLEKAVYKIDPECIKYTKIHCTACNAHLGSALNDLGNIFVHPLLFVLVCKECFDYYSKGSFETDDDGSEEFCRWCGQGGGVLCCNVCPMVFCKMCIRINFGISKYAEIRDNDDWKCFSCDPSQIMAFKVQCHEYARYVQSKMCMADSETADFYMKTDFTQCCSSSVKSIKKRKASSDEDPDYDPDNAMQESEPKMAACKKENGGSTKFLKTRYTNLLPVKNIKIEHDEPISKPAGSKTTFLISEKLKTDVTDTKHRIGLIVKNPDASKSAVQVLGNTPNSAPQACVATDILAQKNELILHKQPTFSMPTNVDISTQNQSNSLDSCKTIIPTNKPIWTFTKIPQKSIIISTSQNPGQQKSFSLLRPSSVPTFTYKNVPDANKNTVDANKNTVDANKNPPTETLPRNIIDKAILDTALANGTFGSSILQLQQKFKDTKMGTAGDCITLYNAFQESVSNMIGALLDVKKEHILASISPGRIQGTKRLAPVNYHNKGSIPVSNFYEKQATTPAFFSIRPDPVVLIPSVSKNIDSNQKSNS